MATAGSSGNECLIIKADVSHLQGITEIYNEAIANSTATFDTEAKTIEDREIWLASHGTRHPVLVACMAGSVVGWAAVSEYSPRPAYRFTGEDSVYVRHGFRGCGIGKALLHELMDQARSSGYHSIIGRVVDGNTASIRLHEQAGFSPVGCLREVGLKFDRWLDVLFMQALL